MSSSLFAQELFSDTNQVNTSANISSDKTDTQSVVYITDNTIFVNNSEFSIKTINISGKLEKRNSIASEKIKKERKVAVLIAKKKLVKEFQEHLQKLAVIVDRIKDEKNSSSFQYNELSGKYAGISLSNQNIKFKFFSIITSDLLDISDNYSKRRKHLELHAGFISVNSFGFYFSRPPPFLS